MLSHENPVIGIMKQKYEKRTIMSQFDYLFYDIRLTFQVSLVLFALIVFECGQG